MITATRLTPAVVATPGGEDGVDPTRFDTLSFAAISTLFVVAEALIFARFGELGLSVHAVATLALFWLIHTSEPPMVLLFQSMLLIPVLRIFNLGLPLVFGNSLLIIAVLYLFLGISVVMVVRSQELSPDALGMTVVRPLRLVLGAVLGLGLGMVQYLFLLEEIAYEPTLANYVLVVLTTGLLVALVEETIFRGLVQRWAAAAFDDWTAILVVSLIFGFMHSVWLAPMDIAFAGLISVYLGYSYARTNDLWYITTVHGTINVAAFFLLPLAVPGLQGALGPLVG